jgi:hypothetical protein
VRRFSSGQSSSSGWKIEGTGEDLVKPHPGSDGGIGIVLLCRKSIGEIGPRFPIEGGGVGCKIDRLPSTDCEAFGLSGRSPSQQKQHNKN